MQEHDQTAGEGVARDASQEGGKLQYRCQSMTRGRKDQARHDVDLVPVVSPPDDWFGYTQEMSARNAGRCSTVETDQFGA